MSQWSIFNSDAVEWARNYTGEKFHALLTDAPDEEIVTKFFPIRLVEDN